MVILYSGLQGIPHEFYEAAAIDGSSTWQRFRYITLPMLEPVIGIELTLGFISTLKVFDIIYVIISVGQPMNSDVVNLVVHALFWPAGLWPGSCPGKYDTHCFPAGRAGLPLVVAAKYAVDLGRRSEWLMPNSLSAESAIHGQTDA